MQNHRFNMHQVLNQPFSDVNLVNRNEYGLSMNTKKDCFNFCMSSFSPNGQFRVGNRLTKV